jgi:hypothetical protein
MFFRDAKAIRTTKMTGRPPWIPPDLEQVEALAHRGLSDNQIALALGIHRATLYRKRTAYSDFDYAIKRGRALGIADVASRLYESALAGDTVAAIFYLKAKGKWRDRHLEVQIEAEKRAEERIEEFERSQKETRKLIRAFTPEEREQYLKLVELAGERVRSGIKVKRTLGPLPSSIAALEVKTDIDE